VFVNKRFNYVRSDEVSQRLVGAGLELAGRDANDRDSATYKETFRAPVYETMFDLCAQQTCDVVLVGPFTSELRDAFWIDKLQSRFGKRVEIDVVVVVVSEKTRRARMISRGAERDRPKLANWEEHSANVANLGKILCPHRVVENE